VQRDELARLRPAEVVYRPRPTYGFEILRGRTKGEVAKAAGRGVRRGDFASVSEVVAVRSGGYAAKAVRLRPPKEPIPMWAKILVRIGLVLIGLAVAGALFLFALSALIGSLLALPWLTIVGCIGAILLLLIVTPVGRSAVRVVVDVTVR
jgi:hypothetical protein